MNKYLDKINKSYSLNVFPLTKKQHKRVQKQIKDVNQLWGIWYHTSKILCYKNIRLCEKCRNEILYLLFSISWHKSTQKFYLFYNSKIEILVATCVTKYKNIHFQFIIYYNYNIFIINVLFYSAHRKPLQDVQFISMNKIPEKSLSVDSNTLPLHPVVQTRYCFLCYIFSYCITYLY